MLDQSPQNKMMTAAPAKKEYHFAANAEHLAEVVYADTIEQATSIYHRVKRLINPPLSTPQPVEDKEEVQ
jgi:hypothetical protein